MDHRVVAAFSSTLANPKKDSDSAAEDYVEDENEVGLVIVTEDGNITSLVERPEYSEHQVIASLEQEVRAVAVDRQHNDFAVVLTENDDIFCIYKGKNYETSHTLK